MPLLSSLDHPRVEAQHRLLQAAEGRDSAANFWIGLASLRHSPGFSPEEAEGWLKRAWELQHLAEFRLAPGRSIWSDSLEPHVAEIRTQIQDRDSYRDRFPRGKPQLKRWYQRPETLPWNLAAFALGQLFQSRESPAAIEWYQRAAEGGIPEAMVFLGRFLRLAHGKNCGSSLAWFEKARVALEPLAQEGCPEAQYRLGVLLHEGWGGETESFRAAFYLRAAARAGHLDSERRLEAIRSGLSLPKLPPKDPAPDPRTRRSPSP